MAASRIFICYRREDSGDTAHWLHSDLTRHFGDDEVFIDRNVRTGSVVRLHLKKQIESCVVMLVVIGPEWLTVRDEETGRRLDSDDDLVRYEIVTALENRKDVLPLLVKDARLPARKDLPEVLAPLAGRAEMRLDRDYWRSGVDKLITEVSALLDEETAGSAGGDETGTPPVTTPVVPWWKRKLVAGCAVAALLAVAIAIFVLGSRSEPLRIYSSLPHRGLGAERTTGMENAIDLALDEAHHKAGGFEIAYSKLDDSDPDDTATGTAVRENARRAAADDNTAAYIGDFTSDQTQQSLPILSAAGVAQIAVSSTRVGLTVDDHKLVDDDEPGRYHKGHRNFVRIIPNADVHAQAQVGLMLRDGCTTAAMIDDGSSYGQDLANHILESNHGNPGGRHMNFRFSTSVGAHGRYKYLADRARDERVNCFAYSGTLNKNTIDIFTDFARKLVEPRRPADGASRPPRLYGSNGLVAAKFYARLKPELADRVTLMVPPYDAARFSGFEDRFRRRYGTVPDPYAAYAYEATQLALDAIGRSRTGKRKAVVDALFATRQRPPDSVLLDYRITGSGDTSVTRYGSAPIENGELGAVSLEPGAPG